MGKMNVDVGRGSKGKDVGKFQPYGDEGVWFREVRTAEMISCDRLRDRKKFRKEREK